MNCIFTVKGWLECEKIAYRQLILGWSFSVAAGRASGGGITRINGTNAVHLEAIDHGTVQPSTQMYQYFPEQPIDLLSSRGCIIKNGSFEEHPSSPPSNPLRHFSSSFAYHPPLPEPLSLLAIVCQNSPLHPLFQE